MCLNWVLRFLLCKLLLVVFFGFLWCSGNIYEMFNLMNMSLNFMCDGYFLFIFFRFNKYWRLDCDFCKKEFGVDKLKKYGEVCKKCFLFVKFFKNQRKKEICKFCKKKFEWLGKYVCGKKKYKFVFLGLKRFFFNKKNVKSYLDFLDVFLVEIIIIFDEERLEEDEVRESDREFFDDDMEIIEFVIEY